MQFLCPDVFPLEISTTSPSLSFRLSLNISLERLLLTCLQKIAPGQPLIALPWLFLQLLMLPDYLMLR